MELDRIGSFTTPQGFNNPDEFLRDIVNINAMSAGEPIVSNEKTEIICEFLHGIFFPNRDIRAGEPIIFIGSVLREDEGVCVCISSDHGSNWAVGEIYTCSGAHDALIINHIDPLRSPQLFGDNYEIGATDLERSYPHTENHPGLTSPTAQAPYHYPMSVPNELPALGPIVLGPTGANTGGPSNPFLAWGGEHPDAAAAAYNHYPG